MSDFFDGLMGANGVFLAFSIATFVGVYIEIIKELFDDNSLKDEGEIKKKLWILKICMFFVVLLAIISIVSSVFTFLGMLDEGGEVAGNLATAWRLYASTVGVLLIGMIVGIATVFLIEREKRG
jgi:uncharacterized BrkB/YihY/UPF0761 family membrane protein